MGYYWFKLRYKNKMYSYKTQSKKYQQLNKQWLFCSGALKKSCGNLNFKLSGSSVSTLRQGSGWKSMEQTPPAAKLTVFWDGIIYTN